MRSAVTGLCPEGARIRGRRNLVSRGKPSLSPGIRDSRLPCFLLLDNSMALLSTLGGMVMFRSGKWMVVGLAACLFAAHEARAIGFQPVSPDELKMTSEPQAPGAPAIILYRQVDRDDNIHTAHEDNYYRIKILTEEGRKHADVEIPFWNVNENVVNVKARTIRPD